MFFSIKVNISTTANVKITKGNKYYTRLWKTEMNIFPIRKQRV